MTKTTVALLTALVAAGVAMPAFLVDSEGRHDPGAPAPPSVSIVTRAAPDPPVPFQALPPSEDGRSLDQ